MSSVNSVGNNSPIQQTTTQPVAKPPAPEATRPLSLTDRVELSGAGPLLKSLKANDIRVDKVASIKAQIEAGTYEDDHKLNVAADRLLDDLNK